MATTARRPAEALPWLLVVARNTISNHHRTDRRRDALTERMACIGQIAGSVPGADVTVTDRTEVLAALTALTTTEREAMRPDTGVDDLWPRHLQATARARVMATTAEPVVPAVRRRRVGAVTLAAALFTVGGVGAAAASGMVPKVLTDAYSFWLTTPPPGETAVDPAAAERIGSIPGPDGTVFSVLVARGAWRVARGAWRVA